MSVDPVRDHFDEVAPGYDRWKSKARYYYSTLKAYVAEVVPPGQRVLEVGCGTGDILASLAPAVGLGVDLSPKMVALAAAKHPDLDFAVHDLMGDPLDQSFDFVVAADVAEHVPDLAQFMAAMAGGLAAGGRIVVTTTHPSWGPWLDLAERFNMKMPEGDHVWRSRASLLDAAGEAGLRVESYGRSFVIPKAIPVLKSLNVAPRAAPLRERYGMIQRLVLAAAAQPDVTGT